jgi:hypothetical protein
VFCLNVGDLGGEFVKSVAFSGSDLSGAVAHDDGSSLHWEYLGTVDLDNDTITCLASNNGEHIFVGIANAPAAAAPLDKSRTL